MPDFTLIFTASGKYPQPNPPTDSLAATLKRSMQAYGFEGVEVLVVGRAESKKPESENGL